MRRNNFSNTGYLIPPRFLIQLLKRKKLTEIFACTKLTYCVNTQPNESFINYALQGFDEYMNLVLDDAEEVSVKRRTRKTVGKLPLHDNCATYKLKEERSALIWN